MKNLLFLVLLAMIYTSCTNQPEKKPGYTINGTIEGDYSGYVYLNKRISGEWIVIDSTQLLNNAFVFQGDIEFPEMLYISISGNGAFSSLFVEPSVITYKANVDDMRNSTIIGSNSNNEWAEFIEKMSMFDDLINDAWKNAEAAMNDGDAETEKKWRGEIDSAEEQMKGFVLNNAKANNKSVVAVYAVLRNAYYYDENDLEPLIAGFDPSIHGSVYYQQLDERVKTMKRVAIGQPAINFTMNDVNGNPVELSSITGNYLLVDFWASWCGPCRRENPFIVAAYNKFHDKGFDILGVSLDNKHENWIEAIAVDNLTWHHVSDLKGWSNEAAKMYAVNSIPANVLLDPDGIIIAKNLKGEALMEKLAELIKF